MQYSKEFLLELHKNLLETRLLEEKMKDLYAQGRVPGHVHSGMGQEAGYVGTLSTRRPGDYFKLTHRPTAMPRMLGTPLEMIFGELLAKKTGNSGGRGGSLHIGELRTGVLGMSGTLGCDAGVAVGAALTIDLEGRDNMVYMFMGDGTSSRGPVYEAMNLAAAWKLPVLFICENNQYAISTHVSTSIPVENALADRAAGYGMPARVADGTDVLAVYEAAREMSEYVRSGKGPAVLECKDYRWRGHFEGDQCAYRDAAVAKEWMENRDCVKNLEALLSREGILTAEEAAARRAAFDAEMEAAIARAEAAPSMTPGEIYDGLYA